ncbi:ATPase [mine drainage metagenome]|uniref:ATPase n=1 Tax=mine drainage metagenome TaxID=410659 RepID=T1CAC3_9ZZZZ
MELLELLNPWWKERKVSKDLALPYRRVQFLELKKLLAVRPITVISGLRRVGKSVLIYQMIDELISSGTNPDNILYFSFDQKTEELLDIFQQYKELSNCEWESTQTYVFLDEIQKLKDWSNKLKLFYDRFPRIKFVISGSSSFNLEKDAIKNLTGRHFEVNVRPLSFAEYLQMINSKIELDKQKLWHDEIKKGFKEYLLRPYPELVKYNELSLIKSYIKENVIDKILRDDLSNFKDINEELATNLINIFYDKPGMYVNYDKLSADLKISKRTLLRHVFYLEFAYLIRKVKNYRPATRSTSRKMQRIYPYHFSLEFGWNGNLNLECEVMSLYDSKYYWNDGNREVDVIVTENKLLPIEVKETSKVSYEDTSSLKYFMAKFKVKDGILIYNGEEAIMKDDKSEIRLMPVWKAFLNPPEFSTL